MASRLVFWEALVGDVAGVGNERHFALLQAEMLHSRYRYAVGDNRRFLAGLDVLSIRLFFLHMRSGTPS